MEYIVHFVPPIQGPNSKSVSLSFVGAVQWTVVSPEVSSIQDLISWQKDICDFRIASFKILFLVDTPSAKLFH
jgi:hypothetical protein